MQQGRLAVDTHICDVPAGSHELGAQLERVGHAHGFDRHIGPQAAGQVSDRIGGLLGSNGAVRPELERQLTATCYRVNGHDGGGREQRGCHQRRKADGPAADDRHDVPGADTPGEDPDLVCGREDVGQIQDLLVAHTCGDRVSRIVGEGDPGVLGLHAVDQVPEDPTPTFEALAEAPFPAEAAVPAGRDARQEHAVTFPTTVDTGPAFDHRPHSLVTEYPSWGHLGNVTLQDVEVRPADGHRVDLDDHVGIGLQLGVGDLVPALLIRAVINDRSHGATPRIRASISMVAHGEPGLQRRRSLLGRSGSLAATDLDRGRSPCSGRLRSSAECRVVLGHCGWCPNCEESVG